MKVHLPPTLVSQLCSEYPGCLSTAEAVGDMVASIVAQHLALNGHTRSCVVSWQSPEAVPAHRTPELWQDSGPALARPQRAA